MRKINNVSFRTHIKFHYMVGRETRESALIYSYS